MDWEDFKESLGKIKANYREFIFGIIMGLAFGILISFLILGLELFLLLVNVVLTAIVLVSLNRLKAPSMLPASKDNPKPKTKRKACPECGSSGRHKKTCSRGKKK
jgi:uncharacterized paraquat-inducible protein A